ncbi:MAG: zf-HC2 domain-containing protein, partial [Bacteroidetes bacterium]|nr:zf-HC2 domain-containing protein [Bacteroidota bacterium]
MVDCRESRELMSGAVDNQLLKNESQGFYEHIEICGSCKDEFDLERLTKAYIRRKITLVDVPYDLEQAIMAQLFAEGGLEFNPGFFTQLFSSSI